MWEGIDISGKWRLFSMVFNGSGSIVRNQNKSWKFRNYEILRKSEEIKRNFFNKKASDIHKYFPGNWTRPNDEVPYIRDGLLPAVSRPSFHVWKSEMKMEGNCWWRHISVLLALKGYPKVSIKENLISRKWEPLKFSRFGWLCPSSSYLGI